MDNTTPTIRSDTVARTVVLVLALFNQILAIAGHETISFADNDVYQLVSLGWTVAASLAAWWKNNSFTCLACEADAWRRDQLRQAKEAKNKQDQ